MPKSPVKTRDEKGLLSGVPSPVSLIWTSATAVLISSGCRELRMRATEIGRERDLAQRGLDNALRFLDAGLLALTAKLDLLCELWGIRHSQALVEEVPENEPGFVVAVNEHLATLRFRVRALLFTGQDPGAVKIDKCLQLGKAVPVQRVEESPARAEELRSRFAHAETMILDSVRTFACLTESNSECVIECENSISML